MDCEILRAVISVEDLPQSIAKDCSKAITVTVHGPKKRDRHIFLPVTERFSVE